MVDYKELFLILCKKIAKDYEEYESIKEDIFKKILESEATPQEQIEYVTAIHSKKHLPPMK